MSDNSPTSDDSRKSNDFPVGDDLTSDDPTSDSSSSGDSPRQSSSQDSSKESSSGSSPLGDDVFGSASGGDVSSSQDTSGLKDSVGQDTTQLNVKIPTEIHRRLKAYSARTGTPMKEVVANVLAESLEE